MHCPPIANKIPLENGHAANVEERSEISRGGVYVDGAYRRCRLPSSHETGLVGKGSKSPSRTFNIELSRGSRKLGFEPEWWGRLRFGS
jgi:hypothetical protein